jgi:hypothetical protein
MPRCATRSPVRVPLLALVAEILRQEIITPVDGLAVPGDEEHEHVGPAHPLAQLGKNIVEIGRAHIRVEHGLELDSFVNLFTGLP